MVNVYDFDGTIYLENSSKEFFIFCTKKKPIVLIYLPIQIICLFLFRLHITNDLSYFYLFLRLLKKKEKEKLVKEFWDLNESKVCKWYLEQKREDDVIVSASPEFLIKEIANRLGVSCVASNISLDTGKNYKTCRGKEKVTLFYERYPHAKIDKSYGNAKSDYCIMEEGRYGYFVKNITIDEAEITLHSQKND
jgi:phosphoserine phosphatase